MCKPAGHAALHVKLTSSAVWDRRPGGSEVGGGGGEKVGSYMKETGILVAKLELNF